MDEDEDELTPQAALEKLRNQRMDNGLTAGDIFTDADLVMMLAVPGSDEA
jgi:hypothetical protein